MFAGGAAVAERRRGEGKGRGEARPRRQASRSGKRFIMYQTLYKCFNVFQAVAFVIGCNIFFRRQDYSPTDNSPITIAFSYKIISLQKT